MAEFTMDLDLSGEGGGIDEDDIRPVYEYLNGKYMGHQGRPSVDFGGPAGDGLSVGGNPTFAGKQAPQLIMEQSLGIRAAPLVLDTIFLTLQAK